MHQRIQSLKVRSGGRAVAALSIAAMMLLNGSALAAPLPESFNYQGMLNLSGSAFNGNADVMYELFDASVGGIAVGSPLLQAGLPIAGGRLSADLNFGPGAFNGQARWLQISVRTPPWNGSGSSPAFTVLSPRQSITPAPNALFAMNATEAATAQNATSLNGQAAAFYQDAGNLTGTISSGRIAGTYDSVLSLTNESNTFAGSGAGLTALNASNITTGTLGTAQVPDLDASKITTGTLGVLRIPNLDASKIVGGFLSASVLPTTGDWSLAGGDLNIDAYTLYVDSVNNHVGIGTAPNILFALDVVGNVRSSAAVNAATFSGSGAALTALNASNITTGTLGTARIPDLDASKITTGTLGVLRIPNLDASKITTGTLANARTTGVSTSTPDTLVLRDASNNFSAGTITASLNGNATTASNATNLNGQTSSFYTNASNIASGVLTAARLPVAGDWALTNDLNIDSNTLYVSGVNNRVGIGTNSIFNKLDVEGAVAIGASYSGSTVAPANGLLVEGNVGIGTNPPTNRLSVGGDADISGSVAAGSFTGSGAGLTGLDASNISSGNIPAASLPVTGNWVLSGGDLNIDANTLYVSAVNNRVGIGTSTIVNKLDVEGGVAIGASYSGTNVAPNNGLIVQAKVGISEPVPVNALDVSGSAVIGRAYSGTNTAPADGLLVEGGIGIGTTAPTALLSVNGTANKPGGGSWATFSDARLKHDIEPLQGTLGKLLSLRGVSFYYNDPASINERPGQCIGMVAQEVEQVFPDWVELTPLGYKSLTFRGFEALTVEALRELRTEKDTQIHTLTATVEKLQADNMTLSTRLERLERLLGMNR